MSSSTGTQSSDWLENRPLEKVCEPDEGDVLFSAESTLLPEHEGNEAFLQMITTFQDDYQSKSQLERPMVALDILQDCRSKGIRFLKFDEQTRLWNDIGDKKARQRIARALKNQANNDSEEQRNSSEVSDVSETKAEEETSTRSAATRRISTKLNYAREGKLYGRKEQVQQLVNVYHQLKQDSGKHLVLISGERGAGKSALAHSLQSTVELDGGFFLEAKFEELREESTAVLVTLLADFCKQILQRDETVIESYRNEIQTAVEEEARILTTLVPELLPLLGSDDDAPLVDGGQGSQATKRIIYMFQSFLKAIVSRERPLVVLLDDLHWANESSLDMLVSLVSGVDGLLFLGIFRNDDDSASLQALNERIVQMDTSAITVDRIELSNLDEDSVRFMLADALLLESDQLRSVGHLVFSMTSGNVFFIMELLRSLQDEELLQFDETTQQWTCDTHTIQVAVDVQTVYDLFKSKINDLPIQVQETLKIASCFGSRLDPYMLKLLVGDKVLSYLNIAETKGLLVSYNDRQAFAFAHDGIQQVTYSLIGDGNKQLFHLKIGQKLLQKLSDDDLEKRIFVVAQQLMFGDSAVEKQEERAVLASIYLRAGEKAVEQSNFETAAVYLKHGTEMLSDEDWKDNYDLTLRLYNAAAEVFYCTAQFDSVSKSVNAIFLNARCFEDTLRARSTQIYSLGSRNRQPEAIEIGLATLRELGEDLPSNPSCTQLMISMWRVKRLLRGMSDTALMRLPVMKVSRKVAAMQMLNLIWLSAMYSRPILAGLVALRLVKLTVTYGKCAVSCVGFGFYSMLLCGGGSNIDEGYRYGKLSLEMYEEFKNEAWLCRVSAAFYGCVWTWKKPVSESIKPLDHAYRVGLGTGDIEYAVLCASMNCWNNSSRIPLYVLDQQIQSLVERIEFLGQETAFFFLKPLWQMTQNFMGRAEGNAKILSGKIMNQETLSAEAVESSPGLILWIRYYCMVLALFLGDYDRAEEFSSTSHEIYDHGYGGIDSGTVLFFECMTLVSQARRGKRGRVPAVRKRLKRLRHFAKHSPLNFLGKQYLIEAELSVAMGDNLSAMSKYTSSIVLCREEGFIKEEALANELAGKFCLEQGDEESAIPFFRESFRLYELWGGKEKIRHLREELEPLQVH